MNEFWEFIINQQNDYYENKIAEEMSINIWVALNFVGFLEVLCSSHFDLCDFFRTSNTFDSLRLGTFGASVQTESAINFILIRRLIWNHRKKCVCCVSILLWMLNISKQNGILWSYCTKEQRKKEAPNELFAHAHPIEIIRCSFRWFAWENST